MQLYGPFFGNIFLIYWVSSKDTTIAFLTRYRMQFHYVFAQYREKCRPQCGLHSNGGSEYYCEIMLIVLESGLRYYGGDVYVKFHKQLFP